MNLTKFQEHVLGIIDAREETERAIEACTDRREERVLRKLLTHLCTIEREIASAWVTYDSWQINYALHSPLSPNKIAFLAGLKIAMEEKADKLLEQGQKGFRGRDRTCPP